MISSGGYCTTCPRKCHWSDHHNIPYKYVHSTRTKMVTLDGLKKRWNIARGKKVQNEELLRNAFVCPHDTDKNYVHFSFLFRRNLENTKRLLTKLRLISEGPWTVWIKLHYDLTLSLKISTILTWNHLFCISSCRFWISCRALVDRKQN